jgi:hypothetical protein
MDEELFAIALRSIARANYFEALQALEAYALDFGGANGRFYPSRFREFLQPIEAARIEADRLRVRLEAARMTTMTTTALDRDWAARRMEIRAADKGRVEDAIAWLESIGWRRPAGGLDQWPSSWTLAVSDLISDREIDGQSARGFWLRAIPSRPQPAEPPALPA